MSELKQRIAGMSLDKRALLEQRLLRTHSLRGRQQTIPRRKPADPAWLSFGQQQMWLLDQLTPGTSTYNIPDVVRVRGPLDIEALEKGLQEIVRRHEVLRTHLASVDGNPVPVVDEQWEMKLAVFDLRSLPVEKREAEANRILLQETRKPFNIAQDVTLRAVVVRLVEDEHWVLFFLWWIHHRRSGPARRSARSLFRFRRLATSAPAGSSLGPAGSLLAGAVGKRCPSVGSPY